jgi:hypothetical protein
VASAARPKALRETLLSSARRSLTLTACQALSLSALRHIERRASRCGTAIRRCWPRRRHNKALLLVSARYHNIALVVAARWTLLVSARRQSKVLPSWLSA